MSRAATGVLRPGQWCPLSAATHGGPPAILADGPEHSADHVGEVVELVTGPIAAGGGCVARAQDGRVVFVRHSLPGERVLAQVTAATSSFLRADAVEILESSPDRVPAPCPHAGPSRCGGCDWQHVSLPAQRILKSTLIAEQLHRLAGIDRTVVVEEVDGAPDGLGWRTRVRFAVDRSGRTGLRRHRSRTLELVAECPIATDAVNQVGVGTVLWRGAHQLEVTASPDGGRPTVSVETGRARLAGRPTIDAGLVVNGRSLRRPDRVGFTVLGNRFEVSPDVFWQVHPGAAGVLTRCVLDGLVPAAGERVADLYAGAGLFTVPLAQAVGPRGSVLAVERSGRAYTDAARNAVDLHQVEIVRSPSPSLWWPPSSGHRISSCSTRPERVPVWPSPGPLSTWCRRRGQSPTSRAIRHRSPETSGSCSMPDGRCPRSGPSISSR